MMNRHAVACNACAENDTKGDQSLQQTGFF